MDPGSDTPSQAGSYTYGSMNFIQPCDAGLTAPKITNSFQRMIWAYKMLNCNTLPIPNLEPDSV